MRPASAPEPDDLTERMAAYREAGIAPYPETVAALVREQTEDEPDGDPAWPYEGSDRAE